jgi:glycosyltransferase involved in cell wall biosynthesis
MGSRPSWPILRGYLCHSNAGGWNGRLRFALPRRAQPTTARTDCADSLGRFNQFRGADSVSRCFGFAVRQTGGSPASRISVRLPEWPPAVRTGAPRMPGLLHEGPVPQMRGVQQEGNGNVWECSPAIADLPAPVPGQASHGERRSQSPRGSARTIPIWNGVAAPPETQPVDISGAFDGPIGFGYLGRLVTEKGLPVLLQASRELAAQGHSFRLKIVGDGPERASLEAMAREFGLADRTEFVGAMPAHAIRDALRGVAVIVMPSVWEDVSPLVAMEQMMDGRLLMASNIGGLGQIVAGGGIAFPPGDAGALAAQMRRVLNEPRWAAALGRAGQQKAFAAFRVERMVAEHVDLYQSLVRE